MQEQFIAIPGFEGLYEVSNFGRVRSLERREWRVFPDREAHWSTRREKILKPCQDGEGYVHVRLCKKGKYTLWKVHQLVALVFLDHDRKTDPNFIVHHKNENKRDNRLENLEIKSRAEHVREHKLGKKRGGK